MAIRDILRSPKGQPLCQARQDIDLTSKPYLVLGRLAFAGLVPGTTSQNSFVGQWMYEKLVLLMRFLAYWPQSGTRGSQGGCLITKQDAPLGLKESSEAGRIRRHQALSVANGYDRRLVLCPGTSLQAGEKLLQKIV